MSMFFDLAENGTSGLRAVPADPTRNGLAHVHISLDFVHKNYSGLTSGHPRIPDATLNYQSNLDRLITLECRVVREIEPGLFLLREATRAERQIGQSNEQGTREGEALINSCRPMLNGDLRYGFYLSDSNPVGFGRCDKAISDDIRRNPCSFIFWMNPETTISVGFPRSLLHETRDVYNFVQGFLADHTDLSKSQNVTFQME